MRRSFSPRIIGLIFFIVLVFFILNLTGFDKEIKNLFYGFSQTISRNFWQAGDSLSSFFSSFWRTKYLSSEVEGLHRVNRSLLAEVASLRELKEENSFLREALGVGLEKDYHLEIAQIVGKDFSDDSLLIDKGREDGISEGLPVITKEKVLLGQIGQVYDDFSEVILVSNEELSFDAKVSGKEVYGLVKGKGSFQVALDLIPKEETVSEGDQVITAALGGIFPKGILVGSIKEVRNSDLEAFQQAILRPEFSLSELIQVFIITDF